MNNEISSDSGERPVKRIRAPWVRALLLIPFAATLAVPLYDRIEPTIGGVPFFYWYQLLWVVLAAAIVGVVFLIEG
jgi:hypothetical protein